MGYAGDGYPDIQDEMEGTGLEDGLHQEPGVGQLNDFVNWVLYFKKLLLFHGFTVTGGDPDHLPAYRKIARDVVDEYLINDNAVAFWMGGSAAFDRSAKGKQIETGRQAGELPPVTVFNCEDITYDDSFGVPSLTVKFAKTRKLNDSQMAQLGKRYTDMLVKGKALTLDEEVRGILPGALDGEDGQRAWDAAVAGGVR